MLPFAEFEWIPITRSKRFGDCGDDEPTHLDAPSHIGFHGPWSVVHYLTSPDLPLDLESFISLDYVPCLEDPSALHLSSNLIEMLDGKIGEFSPDLEGEVDPFRLCRHTVLNILNLFWYAHNIPPSEAVSYLALKAPTEVKLHCNKFGMQPGVFMALLIGSWAKRTLQQEVGAKSDTF